MSEPSEGTPPVANWLAPDYVAGLVSAVLTLRGPAAPLADSLTSLLAQTYDKVETVVLDLGGDDETPRVIQESAQRFRQKRGWGIAYERVGGKTSAGEARGRGARASRGEFLSFLAAGDVLLPDKLHSQVAALSRHEELGAVYSFADTYRLPSREVAGRFRLNPPDKLLALLSPGGHWGQPQAFLWRRLALNAAGAPEEGTGAWDDWAYLVRFLARDQKLACQRRVTSRRREPGPADAGAGAPRDEPERVEARLRALEEVFRLVRALPDPKYLSRFAYLLCDEARTLQLSGLNVPYFRVTALLAQVVERGALPLKLKLVVNGHGQLIESTFPLLHGLMKRYFQFERLRWEAKANE
jgi:hypothetical protein